MAVTLADVAARAGVSVATVSRVLNGNYPVSASTRASVDNAVRELGYLGNGPARSLAGGASEVIGVIVNDVSDPFFAVQASAAQWAAAESGLLALICNTAGDPAAELKYIGMLMRQRVRGLVLVGGAAEEPAHLAEYAKLLRRAVDAGMTVAMCGRPAPPGVDVPQVAFDNEAGAYSLTRHVIAMGHEAVGCIAGPPGNTTTTARLAGHRKALADHGLPDGPVVHGDFSRASGFDATRHLLRATPRPTAIIAANDLMAIGALAALRRDGIDVPGDISLAGFDDLPITGDLTPALTTVRLPLDLGARRASRLAGGIETAPGAAEFWLPAELLVRDSVAAPPRPVSR